MLLRQLPDDSSSTLASRRIAANNSTFDLDSTPAPSKITNMVGDHAEVGPNQTVTTSPVRHAGGARSSRADSSERRNAGDFRGAD
jgi:hypothetical protein